MTFEAQVRRLGEAERFVLGKLLKREPVARNPELEFEAGLSLGDRVADRVAYFGGSWSWSARRPLLQEITSRLRAP